MTDTAGEVTDAADSAAVRGSTGTLDATLMVGMGGRWTGGSRPLFGMEHTHLVRTG